MKYRPVTIRIAWILLAAALLSTSCARFKSFLYSGAGADREKWQETKRVLDELELKSGLTIADLGAGGGYFTALFSEKAGPGGLVYAVEVDPDMLQLLEEEAARQGWHNVRIVSGTPIDSQLPDASSDLIFLCNVYHHMSDQVAYFTRLKSKLKPGGRIAIIELKPEGLWGGFGSHGTAAEKIQSQMQAAGYDRVKSLDFLKKQNFQIFVVRP